MKNNWITLLLFCGCLVAMNTGCKTPPQNSSATQTNGSGNPDAQAAFVSEVAQFRATANAQLANNTQTIAKQASGSRQAASADKENNSLKKRLAEFKVSTRQAYGEFKTAMTRDMSALDVRIQQLGSK